MSTPDSVCNQQLSCFSHNHVRLISYMTGNACGLELPVDLHINLCRTFSDLSSPPKGKKILIYHQQPGTQDLSHSGAISCGYVYLQFPEEKNWSSERLSDSELIKIWTWIFKLDVSGFCCGFCFVLFCFLLIRVSSLITSIRKEFIRSVLCLRKMVDGQSRDTFLFQEKGIRSII